MDQVGNLDLLSLGVTVAAIGILGFIVFLANPKSATNRAFLFFSLVTVIWGIFNYLSYQATNPESILILLRIVIFLGVLHAFSLYVLIKAFPNDSVSFARKTKLIVFPAVALVAILTLTPLVFVKVSQLSSTGVSTVEKGPGIILFVIIIVYLILDSVITLIKKAVRAEKIEKIQYKYILLGIIFTFTFLFLFNFLLPALFDYVRLIPLGAFFFIPFIAFTFYAIFKHHLLSAKVISTELLTFVLAVVSLIEVIISQNVAQIIFRSGVFVLVLGFGILLIKSVLREVAQREKLEILTKELEAANAKLQLADRMKTQFLSFASHQVKSPITVVKDYASLILDGTYGAVPDKVREISQKIKDSSNRMIALVNNLLDLRRLEEGKVEYNFEDFSLTELVKSVADELQTLAKNKNLAFECVTPPDDIKIKGDKEKLRQVFQNLLDNSVKYTETGWIKIVLEAHNEQAIVMVSDSGLGIPAD
ncbi:MAG TPA: histidine kinase dimerization/phospho-acceptor domain-containing protein, partial [Candidatus Paceibacterota bacterium]